MRRGTNLQVAGGEGGRVAYLVCRHHGGSVACSSPNACSAQGRMYGVLFIRGLPKGVSFFCQVGGVSLHWPVDPHTPCPLVYPRPSHLRRASLLCMAGWPNRRWIQASRLTATRSSQGVRARLPQEECM